MGSFSLRAEQALQRITGFAEVVLASSGTTALIAALLAMDLKPGERVLVPSFGFVGLPQAVLLAGGIPHFVDVEPNTLSISRRQLTKQTDPSIRGIVLIHYGGVPADVSPIVQLCKSRGWFLLEDVAHSLGALHADGPVGSFGDLSIFSFDYQKNIQAGEAGAVASHDPVLTEKLRNATSLGVNLRAQALGFNSKWDWVSKGLKGYPPDYVSALLVGQLQEFNEIQGFRKRIYLAYESELSAWARQNEVLLPQRPAYAQESAWHIFWLLFQTREDAEDFTAHMLNRGVRVEKHYSSLRSTTLGSHFPRGDTPVSDWAGNCLIRLPLGNHIGEEELVRIVSAVRAWKTQS